MMGRSRQKKYFWYCLAAYMLALMLKANIGIYPLFAAIYLLVVKYDFKVLLKQGLILACALLCFMIPWSIRNYIQFQAFIPLTYGSGNPKLLGTYQEKATRQMKRWIMRRTWSRLQRSGLQNTMTKMGKLRSRSIFGI